MAEQDFRGPGAPGYDSLDDEIDLLEESSRTSGKTSGSPAPSPALRRWSL